MTQQTTQLRHGMLVACAGAKRSDANPFGLRNQYLNNPEGFFNLIHERALQIKEIIGSCRVIIHMPAGWQWMGMGYSCQSMGALLPEQYEAIERFISVCLDSEITLGLYLCSRVSKSGMHRSNLLEDLGEMVGFDFNNPTHGATYIHGTIQPWADKGITEFIPDGSSHHDGRLDSFVRLAGFLHSAGLECRMEAIPSIGEDAGVSDGGASDIGEINSSNPLAGKPDLSVIHAVGGAWFWDRFLYLKEKRRFWDADDLVRSAAGELICTISGHQRFDGSVPEDQNARDGFLLERMKQRLAQGFTVLNSVGRSHDDFLAALSLDTANRAGMNFDAAIGRIMQHAGGITDEAQEMLTNAQS